MEPMRISSSPVWYTIFKTCFLICITKTAGFTNKICVWTPVSHFVLENFFFFWWVSHCFSKQHVVLAYSENKLFSAFITIDIHNCYYLQKSLPPVSCPSRTTHASLSLSLSLITPLLLSLAYPHN
jgi:hypothetical protein